MQFTHFGLGKSKSFKKPARSLVFVLGKTFFNFKKCNSAVFICPKRKKPAIQGPDFFRDNTALAAKKQTFTIGINFQPIMHSTGRK
ncbi:hypothetical protein ADUPG1_003891, partial [Aduncisulcus paluster]